MGKTLSILILFIIFFAFFYNLGLNDIWMQNESYYAETVREMIENHNFIIPYYNYELRFNKPPITYWIILLSVIPFGLDEFFIRFPIALMGIGTLVITYKLGKLLFNKEIGIYSAIILSLSVIFIANSKYASPEIPLTFFFTLTMYFFIKGYLSQKWKFYLWAYISLGLAVLTKWFPYYFIIGGIIIFFILIDTKLKWSSFWTRFKELKLHIGIPIAFVIGMWWPVYMYIEFKDEFLIKAFKETIHRAVGEGFLSNIDFIYYFKVILWGFLPYSLIFLFIIFLIKKLYFLNKTALFFLSSWILVPYIIFSIASIKISTYILQTFPAIAILTGWIVVNLDLNGFLKKALYFLSIIIPMFLYIFLIIILVIYLNFSYWLILLSIIPVIFAIIFRDIKLIPFFSAFAFLILFKMFILIEIENFRPYDIIGKIIKTEDSNRELPTLVQYKKIYNLPFYAERKITQKANLSLINSKQKFIALVLKKDLSYFKNVKVLWCGDIYKHGGDSRTFVFIKYIHRYKNGDKSGFIPMCLIKKGGDNERTIYVRRQSF